MADPVITACIRAYSAQAKFIQRAYETSNELVRMQRLNYLLNRWIVVRSDALGDLFSAALAAYLVYGVQESALNTGFALAQAGLFVLGYSMLLRLY